MTTQLFRRRQDARPQAPVERPEVRQYRYLLRTLEFQTLFRLHREALSALDPVIRANVLRTAQDRLLQGRDLTVDDVVQLSRLVTVAEVQMPGIICSALSEMALERLAHVVVVSADPEVVLRGYEDWDGLDPDPRDSASRLVRQS